MSDLLDMVLPEGIPSGWGVVRLDEVSEHITKGATPTTYGFNWSTAGAAGSIPFLRSECVQDGAFNLQGADWIPARAHDQMARSKIRAGDLLMTITGNVGRVCVCPQDIAEANINQHIARIRVVDHDVLDTTYALWALATPRQRKRLERDLTGLAYPQISLTQVQQIPVPAPPLPEQRRIAAILYTLDAAIRRTEQLVAKLQQVKQGLLHDLLTRGLDDNGELRDPERQPEAFVETELGVMPRAWNVQSLGQVVHEATGLIQTGPFGSQLHAHEYVAEGVPVIMPQDMKHGVVNGASAAKVTERRAQTLSRHRVARGDVVFARRGDLSRCAAIAPSQVGWVCGTGCLLVRLPQIAATGEWLAQVYRQDLVQRQVLARAVGSTMVNLNGRILSNLKLPTPPVAEQKGIVGRIDTFEVRLNAERRELAKLQALKQGLAEDLLTGRVRTA